MVVSNSGSKKQGDPCVEYLVNPFFLVSGKLHNIIFLKRSRSRGKHSDLKLNLHERHIATFLIRQQSKQRIFLDPSPSGLHAYKSHPGPLVQDVAGLYRKREHPAQEPGAVIKEPMP